MISLICYIQNKSIRRDRMQISDYQEKSEENMGRLPSRYAVFFWGDENVLKLDRGSGCPTLEYTKCD